MVLPGDILIYMIVIKSGKGEYVDGVIIREGDQHDADEFNSKQDPNAKYWMHAQVIELGNEIEIHSRPEEEEWEPKIKPPNIKPIEVYNVNILQEWGMWKYEVNEEDWHLHYWTPHNGFCQFFEEPAPHVEFTYKENPNSLTDHYMNEFFDDHPKLNGVIKLYFDD